MAYPDDADAGHSSHQESKAAPWRSGRWLVIGLPGVLILVLAGLLMGCLLKPKDSKEKAEVIPFQEDLFKNWEKPDLALILTGQRHGYILPCGCSSPQVGGLERLYNLIQVLKSHEWPVTGVDLGDIPQQQGPMNLPNVQGALKYVVTMKAYEKMGLGAVSFGQFEAALPLSTAIDRLVTDPESPSINLVAYNLKNKDKFLDRIKSWELVKTKGSDLTVGVMGAIGTAEKDGTDQLIRQKDDSLNFDLIIKTLPAAFAAMNAAKPDVKVLLYQGPVEQAVLLAEHKDMPRFDIILCLGADEPPSKPEKVVGQTQIFTVGHKGKYIGVVGLYRAADKNHPLAMKYQLVKLGEEYLTPKGHEKENPVLRLMEEYTKTLKDEDKLSQYPHNRKHAAQIDKLKDNFYVGSKACEKCHKEAYRIWEESAHSKAYQTLVDATRPSLRQFDGECLVCHTVGFDQKTGFLDKRKPDYLSAVGCENCHGPGGMHVADKYDADNIGLLAAINPYKARPGESEAKRVERRIASCTKCHDDENDVHWGPGVDKWEKIAHLEGKKEKKADAKK